nr:VWA domain-containing protein [Acidimicrobiia bacterium]
VLRDKDLARCTPEELREAHRLMAALRLHPPLRPSRRRRPDRRSRRGAPVDLRRSVRDALANDGEILRLATTRRTTRPRRVVLLIDVSGSMAPYARALARFAHAAVAGRGAGRVEVFALGTRLTRITRELSTHDPDAALAAAAAVVTDWDGGTRLGDGLRTFNDQWGVRGLARSAVVVLLSDGWDRGDPGVLAAEVARLRRVAHRVVWVNPLRASPGYEPLARGMAAALPHLDSFVDGHSVASLESLVRLVGEDGS